MRKPLTGEPCAGKLHARFGGRGGLGLLYPYREPCIGRSVVEDSDMGLLNFQRAETVISEMSAPIGYFKLSILTIASPAYRHC